MRIRKAGRKTLVVEIDAEELEVDWFSSLAVGLESAVARLPRQPAMLSSFEVEAAQQFSDALTLIARGG